MYYNELVGVVIITFNRALNGNNFTHDFIYLIE